MCKFIFLISLLGQVAATTTATAATTFPNSALQTCEALLTASLSSSPRANLLLSLREVQEILGKRAGDADVFRTIDTFYGDSYEIIAPVAASLKAKVQSIESALVDPNFSQTILFARILRGERAIRSGLLRIESANKTLEANYASTRQQIRRPLLLSAQWAIFGVSNSTLFSLLFLGHAPLWLGLPVLGTALVSDVQTFKNINYTGFVESQVAFARTRRTLLRLLEGDHSQIAIQTDRLQLPARAADWLAVEQSFAPEDRGDALRLNSSGMNRGWPWQKQATVVQEFKVEHIAYFDEYSGESTWAILMRGPRAPKARTMYKVR